ncbi:hypothetical protein KF728_21245 [Candidatus Obscuribacterales bacterium]|nr:hypothetical protein [Candidatus Obscuribacterales bacterium]MBX3152697.1 hypothetical protein [Candidatus Obscuribacterales bacterium]
MVFIPSYSEMLFVLDEIMRKHQATLMTEFKISPHHSSALAHTMDTEIKSIAPIHRQNFEASIAPVTFADLQTQHFTVTGFREIAELLNRKALEATPDSDRISIFTASAQLNLENYYYFVFLKESLFRGLRQALMKSHSDFALLRISQFFLNSEVRSLRNAFSHATWTANTASSSNSFKYWDGDKVFEMTDERWTFLRNLAHTVSHVVVHNL